jgi:hypothetical protein
MKIQMLEAAFQVLLAKANLICGLAQIYVPVLTGKLRDSIRVEIVEDGPEKKSVRVVAGGLGIPYAQKVEELTGFMKRAVADVETMIAEDIKQNVTEELKL